MLSYGLRSLHRPRASRSVLGALRSRPQPRWSSRCCYATAAQEASKLDYPSASKPYYVTTPIFYVNGAPHIGHLYTMILADVLKRWHQLKGSEAFLSTGTDEHGMKIQQAALRHEIEPKQLCDQNAAEFKRLAASGGISDDVFIRTTEAKHYAAVETFWRKMKSDITPHLGLYKGKHSGWYSVEDECFYPEKLVDSTIVPQTGQKIVVSAETGSKVEWVEEETWFFPLTKYRDMLLEFFDNNPTWIEPASKMGEVRDWVEHNLEDLSVTRPYQRLNWGIQDPDDPSQTIYVWVDALVNYLTITGYGASWDSPDAADKGMWPSDVHVVGKDIIRFHAVYWPAMLLALGLPMPKKILCHNHWTMSGRKMSKSIGNVVDPFDAVQRWGDDPLRYFLMRNGSLHRDTDYSNDLVHTVYTKELQANLGNAYYRVARPKGKTAWSTRSAVDAYCDGVFETHRHLNDKARPELHFTALDESLSRVSQDFAGLMDKHDIPSAIRGVTDLLTELNRFLSDTEPWHISKRAMSGDENATVMLNWVIFKACEALRIACILLQPIMPSKTARILDELKVPLEHRTLEWARPGLERNYGLTQAEIQALRRPDQYDTIFPPIAATEAKKPRSNSRDATLKHFAKRS
ncbi:tRNA synthetases class I (M)-domain-containing protein [Emericellopsis atlantica]|uniref:Methionine--tRNA ligase, mitochondrial n=1 Tax=Emericellopsis atlantica TaxID=2614577 RepID=A0A9P8CKE0_9HYPO|nr:tRNA synthetases class I (M)-domain-containing protein [Emericellopsis atlantica]KAG9250258.1 tRNA synthetases class I (M)-domain-containing protein [Emericellopsis atlantica]